ncbi:hypothetical protein [Lutimonas vermicola]|uniref:Phenylacetate-CoA ligase n=1 Tax=Lutimonas vermicola TaxID=414288 RepID=A0ABU9KZ56_9FLAO
MTKKAQNQTLFYKNKINGNHVTYKSLDDFNNSSHVLTKCQIVNNSDFLTNEKNGSNYIHCTSGSTGTPLKIVISGLAESFRFAAKMRFHKWWGVHFFEKNILVWRIKGKDDNSLSFINKLIMMFKNRLDIDVFNLNDKTIHNYVKKINGFNAKFIRGYKSGLFELATLIDRNNLRIESDSLKVAIVTSEMLLEEEREFIQKIFNCKVANEYGSAESGFYAAECEKGSMHINEEIVYIHVDEDNNAYVTELYNDRMPLINYRNEDQLVISQDFCSCGRTSRIIKEIKGRNSDVIKCQDGTVKSATIFPFIIRDALNESFDGAIYQFRFVQKADDQFELDLVKGPKYSEVMSSLIKLYFHKEIGDDISFKINIVSYIEREPSGKRKFFVKKAD